MKTFPTKTFSTKTFSTKREEKNILYIGIAEGKSGRKKELLRDGLTIRKLGRRFSYLFWEGRNVTGGVQIYSALLPEREKKLWRERKWRPETVDRLLGQTMELAAVRRGCYEQILTPELSGNGANLPVELLAVLLYQQRPFEQVCLSLPGEGETFAEQALWLLRPYLPRIRKAFLCEGENENGYRLQEAMYSEFGLVSSMIKQPEPGMLWLDLRREPEPGMLWPDLRKEPEPGMLWPDLRKESEPEFRPDQCRKPVPEGEGAQKDHNGHIKRVNCRQIWKFLDTAVKNGYNTGVN